MLPPQPLKSVRENWVVPLGLESFFLLYPALKRWAKLGRPLRLRSGQALRGWILEQSIPPDRPKTSSNAHSKGAFDFEETYGIAKAMPRYEPEFLANCKGTR